LPWESCNSAVELIRPFDWLIAVIPPSLCLQLFTDLHSVVPKHRDNFDSFLKGIFQRFLSLGRRNLNFDFLFPPTARSLKCYQCATSSEKLCERNQTLKGCADPSFHCATAMYSQVGEDGTFFSQTYMKTCLPVPFFKTYCTSFNQTFLGRLRNCSISSCEVDYCNGPTPTTPTVPTEVDTSTREGTTSQEPVPTQRDPGARAGSPSTIFTSNAFGLIMTVVALGKSLDICSFS